MKRCKVIALGTGEWIIKAIQMMKKDIRIDLLGVIGDLSVSHEVWKKFGEKLKTLGICTLEFTDENISNADLIFVCEYRRIIQESYVRKYHFVNSHAGILPKYKGFSANPWAIMNGESEIGYTIHRMDEKFDHGDIYYVGRFPIERKQTYAEVYDKIFDDMVERICDILVDIYNGKIKPEQQTGKVVYCSRFCREQGDLKQFAYPTSYILNLYRCMAKPHGTGIYFWHKGRRYYVKGMRLGTEVGVDNYIGIPGKVVNCEDETVWVKTKDNVVIITEIEDEDGNLISADTFHIGCQLGIKER